MLRLPSGSRSPLRDEYFAPIVLCSGKPVDRRTFQTCPNGTGAACTGVLQSDFTEHWLKLSSSNSAGM